MIVDVQSAHPLRTFRQRLTRSPIRGANAFFRAGVRSLAFPIRNRGAGKPPTGASPS